MTPAQYIVVRVKAHLKAGTRIPPTLLAHAWVHNVDVDALERTFQQDQATNGNQE